MAFYASLKKSHYFINASGFTVGRLSNKIAHLLMGKHKPIFSPANDCGDFVVVTNASKMIFTGKKWQQKVYKHHTGYPGGLKEVSVARLFQKNPEEILTKAVKGMLPRNRLHSPRMLRLAVFPDTTINDEHLSKLPMIEPPAQLKLEDAKYVAPKLDPKKHKGVYVTVEVNDNEVEFVETVKKDGITFHARRYNIKKPVRVEKISNAIWSANKGKRPEVLKSELEEETVESSIKPMEDMVLVDNTKNPSAPQEQGSIPSMNVLQSEQAKVLETARTAKPGAPAAAGKAAPAAAPKKK